METILQECYLKSWQSTEEIYSKLIIKNYWAIFTNFIVIFLGPQVFLQGYSE